MVHALELLQLSKVDLHRFSQQNFWKNKRPKAAVEILEKWLQEIFI